MPLTTTDESEAATTTTTTTTLPLLNDIPETDVHEMIAVWERLHQGRKAQQKQAAARAPSSGTIVQQWHYTTLSAAAASSSARTVTDQLWHAFEETCQGVVAISVHDNLVLSVGTNQQVVVYDLDQQRVQYQFAASTVQTGAITCVDHTHQWVVVGTAHGHVQVWQLVPATATARLHGQFPVSKDATTTTTTTTVAAVVDVRIHPNGKHVVATSRNRTSGGKSLKSSGVSTNVLVICCAM